MHVGLGVGVKVGVLVNVGETVGVEEVAAGVRKRIEGVAGEGDGVAPVVGAQVELMWGV